MDVRLAIVVITPSIVEGSCLNALLRSIALIDLILVFNDTQSALNGYKAIDAPHALACLIVDTRVHEHPAASNIISQLLKANPSRLVPLLLHYSATLSDGVIRARMAIVEGFANRFEVDRSKWQWPRRIAAEIEAYLAGHRFLSNIESLKSSCIRETFPLHASVTSELQSFRKLVRVSWRSKANIDAHLAARLIVGADGEGEVRIQHSPAVAECQNAVREKSFLLSRSFNGSFEFRWLDRRLQERGRFEA